MDRQIKRLIEWTKKHNKYINLAVCILALFLFIKALGGLLHKNRTRLQTGLLLLCLAVILLLVIDLREAKTAESENFLQTAKEAAENLLRENGPDVPSGYSGGSGQLSSQDILPSMNLFYLQNQDFTGWLTVPGTAIDYPVMQTPSQEDYYLYRDFYGKEDKSGSLILSAACDPQARRSNLIIHGHNLKSGNMFGGLEEYRSGEYALEHSLMEFTTLFEKRTYQVIAAFVSQVYYEDEDVFKYYQFTRYESPDEFEEFISFLKSVSVYGPEAEAVYGDEFLTLSTCDYSRENGRFVVVGKRIY